MGLGSRKAARRAAQNTTTSTTQNTVPAYLQGAYQDLVNRAQTAANQPYQAYNGNLVAGLSGNTNKAINQAGNIGNDLLPYINQASGLATSAGSALDPSGYQSLLNQAGGLIGSSGSDLTGISGYLNSILGLANSATGTNFNDLLAPYLGQGSNYANQSTQSVLNGVPQYDQATLSQYMNPYLNDVVNSTLADISHSDASAQNDLLGRAISSGASPFGGDRAGLAAAELERNQGANRNSTIANLYDTGFNQAVSQLNNQQQLQLQGNTTDRGNMANASSLFGQLGSLGLSGAQGQASNLLNAANAIQGAGNFDVAAQQANKDNAYRSGTGLMDIGTFNRDTDQANKSNQLAAAQMLSSLGGQLNQSQLDQLSALMSTGALKDANTQDKLDAKYQQFLDKRNYPYDQVNFLSGALSGAGGGQGTSTTSQTTPSPGFGSKLLGLAGTLLPLFMKPTTPATKNGGRIHGGISAGHYALGGSIPVYDPEDPFSIPGLEGSGPGSIPVRRGIAPAAPAPVASGPASPPPSDAASGSGGGIRHAAQRLGAGISERLGGIQQKFQDDPWRLPLLIGGLSTMAGTSPSTLQNVGQGGLAAVQAIMSRNQANADRQAKLDANTQIITGDNGNFWVFHPSTGEHTDTGIPDPDYAKSQTDAATAAGQRTQTLAWLDTPDAQRMLTPDQIAYYKANPDVGASVAAQLIQQSVAQPAAGDLSTDEKNYNFYAQQEHAAGRAPLSFNEWQHQTAPQFQESVITPEDAQAQGLPALPAGWTWVNTETGPQARGASSPAASFESAHDAKAGAAAADRETAIYDGATQAVNQLNTINGMAQLASDPNFYSGIASGSVQALRQLGSALGISDPDAASVMEAFGSMSSRAALDKMGGSLGSGFSDADRNFVLNQVPNTHFTPQGNQLVMEVMRRIANRNIEIAQRLQDAGGTWTPQFNLDLAQWANDNPLFAGLNVPAGGNAPAAGGGAAAPAGGNVIYNQNGATITQVP